MKEPVAVMFEMSEAARRRLGGRFEVLDLGRQGPAAAAVRRPAGAPVRAAVTTGLAGFSAAWMDAMPSLALICCFGAGHENLDIEAARSRGIAVTHAPDTNAETVADHALALMLAATRDIVGRDRAVRAGEWQAVRTSRPTLAGGNLGIIGFGPIGRGIARRAAGFGMNVRYHARHPVAGEPLEFVASAVALAAASDVLVAACPGGPATRHLIGPAVLDALGPGGFVVNIARGSVVDTAALAARLADGRLAGAGLDVFEDEPGVPDELKRLPNVVLTPHVAGRSPAAERAQIDLLVHNLAQIDRPDALIARLA